MHVLLTVNAAWNAYNFRRALIADLIADGHQVTVLAPFDDTAERLGAMGCDVVPLTMDLKGVAPHRDLALMRRYVDHFRRLRPDAILSYTIKNNVYGGLAARRLTIPALPNVTGLGTAFLSGPALRRIAETLHRTAFYRAPTVFFQNGDDRDLFVERRLVREDQVRLVPGSGIDLDHFAPPERQEASTALTFLLIGRLLRDKGVVEFVEAARRVRTSHPEARFQILGQLGAENRSAIDPETVQAWQEEGVIEHLGATDDVRPFIADADCVVLPSYREGTPRTLLEASAMARPVIATDVPGCRQVVDDRATGLLCRVRDADDLAEKMLAMIALGPDRRRAMGQAGRVRMEREFDQRIVVEAYRDALARAASNR
ncbi:MULTISPECIES: glycosyltransferase family 4 protein [unclassified Roseitalea]|uniref:glycosyltransferase family 4 protein n=1 Tax=unclassified Roseitalea TaxID=2639107 RepID=UPI00273CF5AA|nr:MULTISPECIES: glycosyltransferase family 4 protein [unclassified Roseitalea]